MIIRIIFFLLLTSFTVYAQESKDITKWHVSVSDKNAKAGDEVELIFSAQIGKDWKLYSSDFKNDIGPLPTEFDIDTSDSFGIIGEVSAINPKKTVDPTWDVAYTYFLEKGEFRQKIKVNNTGYVVKGTIKGLLCSSVDGLCIPFQESFQIN
jgi:hypothetical protein